MRTARKNRHRYLLDLGSDRQFKLSASEFHELHGGGWSVAHEKTAFLRVGVIAWVRGGDLFLFSLARIRTVSWVRAWLYKVGVIKAATLGETSSERYERLMFEQERERQNEALLWRTFRNTKGANSFSCISAEHKAEILRALRPEMLGEAISA